MLDKKNFIGLLICIFIASFAILINHAMQKVFNNNIIDALLIAMILGIIMRPFLTTMKIKNGTDFTAKYILELGIVLLGFSMNFNHFTDNGLKILILVFIITIICFASIFFVAQKIFKMSSNLSILLATGNSICGNSAIIAIAPIIKATSSEIAIAIGFSAVIGIIQVIIFPILFTFSSFSYYQYGIITGMSIYAVPQVIAASFIVSTESGLIATQIKLLRILLLGPVALLLSFVKNKEKNKNGINFSFKFLPWFIIGFIITAFIANLNLISNSYIVLSKNISSILFIIAMSAIGIKIDTSELRLVIWKVIIIVIFAVALLTIMSISFSNILLLK
ncbi:MAG: putative sulfate exporter family transporter [Dehalococcoidia bacterium]